MKTLWRWIKRLGLLAVLLALSLSAPVIYVETMCRGNATPEPYRALIEPAHLRPETRTLMTYPEWYIVHAYEDYAEVLRTGDPHDYAYLRGIGGFWSSLCALNEESSAYGEVDGATKQMVYVIGVSFTAELALKAAYEETLGRVFAVIRGSEHSPLDQISARQAADYATFLQQVPWYEWPFRDDVEELSQEATSALRDRERNIALGLEYRAKAAYADLIEQAVAQVGADALTLRMIVRGASEAQLQDLDGVSVIQQRPEGIEIETPRYRTLTHLLQNMAAQGIDVVEIAGNDDILLTALSKTPTAPGSIMSARRQGFQDYRHLIGLKVADLAERLRDMPGSDLRLEHIHDY